MTYSTSEYDFVECCESVTQYLQFRIKTLRPWRMNPRLRHAQSKHKDLRQQWGPRAQQYLLKAWNWKVLSFNKSSENYELWAKDKPQWSQRLFPSWLNCLKLSLLENTPRVGPISDCLLHSKDGICWDTLLLSCGRFQQTHTIDKAVVWPNTRHEVYLLSKNENQQPNSSIN